MRLFLKACSDSLPFSLLFCVGMASVSLIIIASTMMTIYQATLGGQGAVQVHMQLGSMTEGHSRSYKVTGDFTTNLCRMNNIKRCICNNCLRMVNTNGLDHYTLGL